jgi:hypothetical protein
MRRFSRSLATLLALTCAAACRQGGTSADDAAIRAAIEAELPGARLVGEVTLADGGDSSGIQVYVPGTSLFAITDVDGSFAIEDVAPGVYKIAARTAGYQPAVLHEALTIEAVNAGEDVRLEPLALLPRQTAVATPTADQTLGTIEGRVRVAGMDAAAAGSFEDTTIELAGTPYRTTCHGDGSFLLWNLPADDYRLIVRRPGAVQREETVRLLPGGRAQVEIALAPDQSVRDGRIRGQVTLYDSQGQITNEFDRITVRLLGTSIATRLEPDGTFALEGVTRGRHIVMAGGEGYGLTTPVEVDLSDQSEATIALTLAATEPTSGETGRVVGFAMKEDGDAENMSGIAIVLTGSQAAATTDPLGRFALDRVPPGIYGLIASAEGYRTVEIASVEVAAGGETELEGIYLERDVEAPVVLETNPGDGERGVMIRREIPIAVRFSQKMVPESLRQAVTIDPKVAFTVFTGGEKPGTDFDLMRIVLYGSEQEPVAQFRTRYTVTIDRRAHDFEGVSLEDPYRFSFTTGDPAVITTLPEDGGGKPDIGPRSPIAIYFNARMDHATLTPDVLRIRPVLTMSPQLSVYDDPATGWTRMHISATWDPETNYSVTIQRRARTVSKDSLTNTPYTFRFKTAKLIPFTGQGPAYSQPSP